MQENLYPELKENIDHVAGFVAAFANEYRLLILCSLLRDELTVSSITKSIGASQACTSQHLKRLSEAALVTSRRAGQSVYYRISSPHVEFMLSKVSSMYPTTLGSLIAADQSAYVEQLA